MPSRDFRQVKYDFLSAKPVLYKLLRYFQAFFDMAEELGGIEVVYYSVVNR